MYQILLVIINEAEAGAERRDPSARRSATPAVYLTSSRRPTAGRHVAVSLAHGQANLHHVRKALVTSLSFLLSPPWVHICWPKCSEHWHLRERTPTPKCCAHEGASATWPGGGRQVSSSGGWRPSLRRLREAEWTVRPRPEGMGPPPSATGNSLTF